MPGLIGPGSLPWARDTTALSIAECRLRSGETFYLASAVDTHRDLTAAADLMTDQQRSSADKMLYSRLPEYVQHGYSPAIDKVPQQTTDFPILRAKNESGQRVYFAKIDMTLDTADKATNPQILPVFVRLAVCDKNRQKLVMKHLSSAGKPDRGSK